MDVVCPRIICLIILFLFFKLIFFLKNIKLIFLYIFDVDIKNKKYKIIFL
jgi:hypothetical protein